MRFLCLFVFSVALSPFAAGASDCISGRCSFDVVEYTANPADVAFYKGLRLNVGTAAWATFATGDLLLVADGNEAANQAISHCNAIKTQAFASGKKLVVRTNSVNFPNLPFCSLSDENQTLIGSKVKFKMVTSFGKKLGS